MKQIIIVFLFLRCISINSQNNSLHFDGAGDNVNLPYTSAIDFSLTSNFSIEAWFKTTSNFQCIYSNLVDVSPYKGLEIAIVGSSLVFEFANDYFTNNLRVGTVNLYNDGNWHHFACVYKGIPNANNLDIYVDGVLQNVNVLSNNLSSPPNVNNGFRIGSRNNTSYYFSGNIDELRVWGKALCSSEIIARKNCQLVGNEPQLLAYYNFNQGVAGGNNSTVTTLSDITGNNISGTLTSFALNGSFSNWVNSTSGLSGICNYSYVTITGTTNICAGAITTLIASGASTYTWNFGLSQPSVTLSPSTTTTYTLSTNSNTFNCSGITIVTVNVNPNPTVSVASSNSSLCAGSTTSLIASGANTYSWSNSVTGNPIVVSPTTTIIYFVTGTSSLTGCNNTSSLSIDVFNCTGLSKNDFSSESISIYPNPNNGIFKINGLRNGCKIEIYNTIGDLTYSAESNSNITEINFNAKPSGIYVLKCFDSGKQYSKRFFKE